MLNLHFESCKHVEATHLTIFNLIGMHVESNLKSIRTIVTIAGECQTITYHSYKPYIYIYVYISVNVVSIECAQNNKSVLSIYTNVIYMVVWPTHLIENYHIEFWPCSILSLVPVNLISIYACDGIGLKSSLN